MTGPPTAEELGRRRHEVLSRIGAAAGRARRAAADVTLLAVTKGHPESLVRSAARAGLRLFGENRVAEGAGKIEAVRAEFPGLVWRLIGPLQTNKAKAALQWFSAIETVDRERLAARIEALLAAEGRRMPVLLEVNVGLEATKSGASPERASDLARAALACPHLDVRGLMTVPPFDADPERARPFFRQLRETRDRLQDELGHPLPELSMGMSHDFEVAVEEGSTEVRIGTALFGERAAR
ncbi:MAG TPA: YggS family pyridoxal phosphate-dependent enzyme [Thermoanaerobaculia bacterium]|nr:YggS family pyridoxal phosphate-dependent enzyme [Thermoanaerobaculia bacterium]